MSELVRVSNSDDFAEACFESDAEESAVEAASGVA